MFAYFINVPLNEKGIVEFEECDEELTNVETFVLTEDEYNKLRKKDGLFQAFDQRFGTIIDVCEEERIEQKDISDALEIAKRFLKKSDDRTEQSGLNKVLESLALAMKVDTFWEIDIYLE